MKGKFENDLEKAYEHSVRIVNPHIHSDWQDKLFRQLIAEARKEFPRTIEGENRDEADLWADKWLGTK